MSEERNIDLVKRHIKNLMSSYSLSRGEFLELYRSIAREQIDRRLDKIFSNDSIQSLAQKIARDVTLDYLSKISGHPSHFRGSTSYFEKIIQEEASKAVKDIINEKFKFDVTIKSD